MPRFPFPGPSAPVNPAVPCRRVLLLLLLAGLSAFASRAQPAEAERWQAHAVSPGGEIVEMLFDVKAVADSFQVTTYGAIGRVPVQAFRLEENTLSFSWNPGFEIRCRLLRQAKGPYKGSCRDGRGYVGPIVMAPPGIAVSPDDFDLDLAFSIWGLTRSAYEAVRYPGPAERVRNATAPTSRRVELEDGTMLYTVEQGAGDVTVVLEAGPGDGHEVWRRVQPVIATRARVIAYDRAGLGQSGPAVTPRSPEQMARELHALLQATGAAPPYVLVAHDAGAFIVRRFAALYPDEVGGLVLIDPAHEQLAAAWKALDAESWEEYLRRKRAFHEAMPAFRAEFEAFARVLDRGVLPGAAEPPPVPVVVISTLRPVPSPRWVHERPEGLKAREALHRAWLAGAREGTHRVTTSSGSYVHVEEPELVLSAIEQVITAVRSRP
ncbi:alpha/beta hydrolase [Rhodocaloribacter litoris]|uniref:alpha/beta fold hydrolase n=1 Tax=Rhodocaloribacter litoris TaxID=2558931 RepID=UPI0014236312|nr:alpha/beta hydrolase [Rhodocaloribacter litoris]QXD16568.1 alpha/beta hydrolase [Rhodocaloribacter litoris]